MVCPPALINVRFPGYEGLQCLTLSPQGIITAIAPMRAGDLGWDLGGDWLSLGGVDLQINGALGLPFPDLTPEQGEKLGKIQQWLWHQGIDGFCPTIVTTSLDKIHTSLATLRDFGGKAPHQAAILGAHLEGPCLHPAKKGAHPAAHLQPLNPDMVGAILGDFGDMVKIMTLAPELDPGDRTIPWLGDRGITVSLGHSTATEAQARRAFDLGATMVTHAFNAMPPLHHRDPGLLGAALTDASGVWCGFIADGKHVSVTMLRLLLRLSDHLFLVSDALAPLGLPDGVYPWDDRQIEVRQGTCHLSDGTLAGTTLPLWAGAMNLVAWGLCDLPRALSLATIAPRRAIGLDPSPLGYPVEHLLWWQAAEDGSLSWRRLGRGSTV